MTISSNRDVFYLLEKRLTQNFVPGKRQG